MAAATTTEKTALARTQAKKVENARNVDDKIKDLKAQIKVAGTLKNVEIDPSRRLADMDRSNNRWKENQKWQTDLLFLNPPSWEKKNNYWRINFPVEVTAPLFDTL